VAKFSLRPDFGIKTEVPYFKVTRISLKHSVEKEEQVEKNAPAPKFSSMRLDVSIEHRLVTDTGKQLDRHRVIASGALAWRRDGKNDGLRQSINQSINLFIQITHRTIIITE